MWRPAHGATNRPGCCRPTNGYGRFGGRPGPRAGGPLSGDPCEMADAVVGLGGDGVGPEDAAFGELVGLIVDRVPDAEAEAPAPVTP